MLVLSRHRDESVVVTTAAGERIVITVVDIRGDKTRLGFDADPSIRIDRDEIDARRRGGAA